MPEQFTMKLNHRSRLVRRLVVYILLFSSLITLLSTAYQLYAEYQRDMQMVHTGLDQVEKSHLDAIVSHLWVYDMRNLKVQLNGILNLPDVQYVEVKTDDGNVVSVGKPVKGKRIDRHFDLTYEHRGKKLPLGSLSVAASFDGIHKRLVNRVIIILSTQAIKTFLVTVFIFFLFYYMIGRHLELLARHSSSLNMSTLDKPFVLERSGKGNKNDELDQVTDALNDMCARLHDGLVGLRHSEEAIRESEAKFRQLAENIPEVFWLGSADWKEIFYISPAYEIIWGKSCESLHQNPLSWMDSIHMEDRKTIEALFPVQWAKPFTPFIFPEYRIVRPDGVQRWILARAFPIVSEKGDIHRIAGIAADITERKNADLKIKDISRLLTKVIEGTTDAIFIKDLEGRYILVNSATCMVFGRPRDEVIGKTDRDLFPEASVRSISAMDSKVISSGKPHIIEEKLQTSEGNTAWLTNKSPYLDDKGNIIGIIGISRNISQIKMIEQEKEQLKTRLFQAQKMESIGTLAGGIAHDFNNILSPLIGYAEMLQEDLPRNSPEQRNISKILQAALRARDLVKQILAFSQKSTHELKPVRLQPIFKEVLKLLKSSIPSTIDVKTDIDPGCGMVVADTTQIHQILMNLATNAYHAMQESGGQLKMTLKQIEIKARSSDFPELLPGKYALINVSDTGTGIKKEIMDKIFDPYFTTKETGKGTGLGLSVVQGIVKSHQGDIRISSVPGQGTQVSVLFPILKEQAGTISTILSGPVEGGTERILLVDDEEMVARMETTLLERMGYQVMFRTGSNEALELFKADPDSFDLIISDMTMPNMTGVQFANEVKAIRTDIPVIICTGFSDQINESNCKELGIQGYIMKPVIKQEISRVIRDVLKKTRRIDEP